MTGFTSKQSTSSRQQRVPETLQAVFLASNRGKEVHKPPPERLASKTFIGNWLFQRQSSKHLVSKKRKQNRRFFFGGASQPIVHSPIPRPIRHRRESIGTHSSLSPPDSPGGSLYGSSKVQAARPLTAPNVPIQMTPQGVLDSLLRIRGYSTQKFRVLETAYYNKPTPLQLASHHVKIVDLARSGANKVLQELITVGLSPNPCNLHGESLIHTICRRGDYQLLQDMIRIGASVQVSDDHGRTPLHDACWSSTGSFLTVDVIIQQDIRLFHMMDARGATPLAYVRPQDWTAWTKFLRSRADYYWPARDKREEGEQPPPPLALMGPNTHPLPDPENALSAELAAMVAAGRITPKEAAILREVDDDDDEDSDSDESDYDSDDFSNSDFSDSEDEEDSEEEEEQSVDEDDESDEEEESMCCAAPAVKGDSGHKTVSTVEGTESPSNNDEMMDSDSSSCDMFDEEEMANLIQGITAPGIKSISWSSM